MTQQPLNNSETQEVAKKIVMAILSSDISTEASIIGILSKYILLPKYQHDDKRTSTQD